MIGTKIYKNNIDNDYYSECAKWCNDTQKGIISDKGDYFEIVDNPFYEDNDTKVLNSLRYQRKKECFPIINRGNVWYDTLTEDQLVELEEWYNGWLNVTETKIIPEKPEWLK